MAKRGPKPKYSQPMSPGMSIRLEVETTERIHGIAKLEQRDMRTVGRRLIRVGLHMYEKDPFEVEKILREKNT